MQTDRSPDGKPDDVDALEASARFVERAFTREQIIFRGRLLELCDVGRVAGERRAVHAKAALMEQLAKRTDFVRTAGEAVKCENARAALAEHERLPAFYILQEGM